MNSLRLGHELAQLVRRRKGCEVGEFSYVLLSTGQERKGRVELLDLLKEVEGGRLQIIRDICQGKQESNADFDIKLRKMFSKLPWVVGVAQVGNQMDEEDVAREVKDGDSNKIEIKFGPEGSKIETNNDGKFSQENVGSDILEDESNGEVSDIDDDGAREVKGQSDTRLKLVTSLDVKTSVDSIDPSWLRRKKGKDFLLDELTKVLNKIENADNAPSYSCKFCQVGTGEYPKKQAGHHLYTVHQDWYLTTRSETIKRSKGWIAENLKNQVEYEKLFLNCIQRIGTKRTEKVFLSKKGKQMVKFGENNLLEVTGERVARLIGKQRSFKGYNNYWCKECGINLPEGHKPGSMRFEVANHIKTQHNAIYTDIGLKISMGSGQELDRFITESIKNVRKDETKIRTPENQSIGSQGNPNRNMMKEAKIDMQNKLGNIFCRINNNYQCKKCDQHLGRDKKEATDHLRYQHSLELKQLQAEFKTKYDDFVNRQLEKIITLVFHKV